MQIPVIYATVTDKEIKVTWDESPGNADDYLFELVGAVYKDSKPVIPIYAGVENHINFKELEKDTDYDIEGNAMVWVNAERILSTPQNLHVTTSE